MKIISSEQALSHLAAYCSKAERCVFDVKQKLIRLEIPEKEQKAIIRKLQDEGFLNEFRFCRAFVNDKSKYNKWGYHKIKYELKKKQIAEELIEDTLSEIRPEENKERLIRLLQAKSKTVKGKTKYETEQKLMRFAAGRGFSQDDIALTMGEIKN
jgi:regulatory protein